MSVTFNEPVTTPVSASTVSMSKAGSPATGGWLCTLVITETVPSMQAAPRSPRVNRTVPRRGAGGENRPRQRHSARHGAVDRQIYHRPAAARPAIARRINPEIGAALFLSRTHRGVTRARRPLPGADRLCIGRVSERRRGWSRAMPMLANCSYPALKTSPANSMCCAHTVRWKDANTRPSVRPPPIPVTSSATRTASWPIQNAKRAWVFRSSMWYLTASRLNTPNF
ncbi:MAG: hypothetical protein QOG75_7221 [Mycobacterium sp.]|nr:hypothetical protein [Mycobacterium sp.]